MKTRIEKTTISKKTLASALTLALSAALLSACGDSPTSTPNTTTAAPPQAQTAAAPQAAVPTGSNGAQYVDVAGLPLETLNLVAGTYQGTLQRLNYNAQPIASQAYTLTLTHDETTVNNQKVRRAFAHLVSNGAVGNIDATYNLYASIQNWGGVYSFITDAKNTTLSSELSALELILTFQNGNQFDPAQSAIYIKGCGFSQGMVCSNVVEDAIFENNALTKR